MKSVDVSAVTATVVLHARPINVDTRITASRPAFG